MFSGCQPPYLSREFDLSNFADLICAAADPHLVRSSLLAIVRPYKEDVLASLTGWISGSMQNLSFPRVPSPGANHIISWNPPWSLSLGEKKKKAQDLRQHSAAQCLFSPFLDIASLLFPPILGLGLFLKGASCPLPSLPY